MKTLNRNVEYGRIVFENYLERAVIDHPLPWNANPCGNKWEVVAIDGFPVVKECANLKEATAIVSLANADCADVFTV